MPKIALVQDGTVLFDKTATMIKVEQKIAEAAENQADLVLFPEAFIGGYPKLNDFGIVMGSRSEEGRDEFLRYYNESIEENGEESRKLATLSTNYNIHVAIGVVERDGSTLYCSVFFYSPTDGFLGKHRKLMPTALERCVWGQGDASTIEVFPSRVGRMAAAICWENYMPLYRMTLYNRGVQVYLAPTVDDRDTWLSTMRTIALEGRCFVFSACQFLESSAYPYDHRIRIAHGDHTVLIRGGSCAVDPLGRVLVEPDFTSACIKYVEYSLDEITRGKMDLDVCGHYARPDIFDLRVL